MTRVRLLQDAPVEGRWHKKGAEFEVVEHVEPSAGPLQVSQGVSDRWLRMNPAWAEEIKTLPATQLPAGKKPSVKSDAD